MKIQYGILIVFISLLLIPAVAAETQYNDCETHNVGLTSDYDITLKEMEEDSVTIKVEGPTEVRTRTLSLEEEYFFFDEIYVKLVEMDYAEKEVNRDATFEICDVTRNICSKENILLFFRLDYQLDNTVDFHGIDVDVTYIGTTRAEVKYNTNEKTLLEGEYYTADNIRVHLEEIQYDDSHVNSRVTLKVCQPGGSSTTVVEEEFEATEEEETEEMVYRATTTEDKDEDETPPMPEKRGGLLAAFFDWLFGLL